MSDIELIIKIPEKTYKHILSMQFYIPGAKHGKTTLEEILKAIKIGKPLPKGHGRLIDMKKLQNFVSDYTEYDAVQLILADREDYLPTIIEAESEE